MRYGYETAPAETYSLLKKEARRMRNVPTAAEAALWNILSSDFKRYHFRRQHVISIYIADFVCLARKLIIEVDGKYHDTPEQKEYDAERELHLKEKGYQIIRFTNEQVMFDHELIRKTLEQQLQYEHN